MMFALKTKQKTTAHSIEMAIKEEEEEEKEKGEEVYPYFEMSQEDAHLLRVRAFDFTLSSLFIPNDTNSYFFLTMNYSRHKMNGQFFFFLFTKSSWFGIKLSKLY